MVEGRSGETGLLLLLLLLLMRQNWIRKINPKKCFAYINTIGSAFMSRRGGGCYDGVETGCGIFAVYNFNCIFRGQNSSTGEIRNVVPVQNSHLQDRSKK